MMKTKKILITELSPEEIIELDRYRIMCDDFARTISIMKDKMEISSRSWWTKIKEKYNCYGKNLNLTDGKLYEIVEDKEDKPETSKEILH